jgi:hypothetical protein
MYCGKEIQVKVLQETLLVRQLLINLWQMLIYRFDLYPYRYLDDSNPPFRKMYVPDHDQ